MASPLGTELCDQPPCVEAIYHDPSYFADLWPRIYPLGYLEPLKDPGPGYEVLSAYAVVFARVSLAIARLDCGAHILDSFGGALANGNVSFMRTNNSAGDATIKTGTIVATSSGGRRYLTLADAVFTGTNLGPVTVQVAAVRPGWEFNVPGQRTTATGVVLPGEIDRIATLDAYLSPSLVRVINDPTFSVNNVGDICGGRQPMLDGLGNDRGLTRYSGESDADFKIRIRTLPETVTPNAIINAVSTFFARFGYAPDTIEPWSKDYQTCYDLTSTTTGINTNLFTYDDPRPAWPPFRNRWLGEDDARGAFIVVVPNLPCLADYGMDYDDTGLADPDWKTSIGVRGLPAYDVPSTVTLYQGCYDGIDAAKAGWYKGLYDLLQRIKAGGVFTILEMRGE